MALIGNNADTLLHGLSDFWLRYFKDLGDLQGIYEGTEILLGQHYLNLLNDVLNIAVTETPLFRKEYYKLYTIRQDQLEYRDTRIASRNRYVFRPADPVQRIPQLQNKVFAATAALEESVEYEIIDGGIGFAADPFTSSDTDAFARRQRVVSVAGFFTSPELTKAERGDEIEIYLSSPRPPPPGQEAEKTLYATLKVVFVEGNRVAISTTTPLPARPPVGVEVYAWRLMRTYADGARQSVEGQDKMTGRKPKDFNGFLDRTTELEVVEMSFWAVDAEVDDGRLFTTFGHLFGDRQRSTEVYRAFIRGLMQLYIHGPAIERVESALNVVANFEVARDDGELLDAYDSGLTSSGRGAAIEEASGDTAILHSPTAVFERNYVGGQLLVVSAAQSANFGLFTVIKYLDAHRVQLYRATNSFVNETGTVSWEFSYDGLQRVTTNRRTYAYPRDIPVRADLKDPDNFGTLELRAFEPLTTAIQVTDYLEDPEWWHNITVPEELFPNQPAARRVVSPALYPNIVGPEGDWWVGDPGLYVGADDEGNPVEEDLTAMHHRASFILLDRFLKMHLFMVRIDPTVDLTGVLINDLRELISAVKPAHTMVYFQPVTEFQDFVALYESMVAQARLLRQDLVPIVDSLFRIGDDVYIGDEMGYAEPNGGALVSPGTGVSLTIGGHSPYITSGTGVLEHVISVTPRPAS